MDQNNSRVILTFVGGSTFNFGLPDGTLTFGDSAEFLGFFRNDLPRITEVRLDFSGVGFGIDNIEYGVVPEPSTGAVAGAGIALLATSRGRSSRRSFSEG